MTDTAVVNNILGRHPEVAYYLRQLVEQLDPLSVILYGSKARGDSTGD